jgi:aspartate/methionine/tyrosine aminotransferase
MTGWRLGWLTTPPRLGQTLEMVNEFNLAGAATFTQLAGITALEKGEDFVAEQVARYERARDLVYQRIAGNPRMRIGWPEGAFYAYFAIEGLEDGLAFCKDLVREAKVGLVPGSAFSAEEEGWLRLCFASKPQTLSTALDRLEDYIEKIGL